jgi:hypothetical protein
MKKGMCKGCDNLLYVDQKKFFDETGRKKLDVPTVAKKPFCREYHLHLEYIERIVDGNDICNHYYDGGIS